MTRVRIIQPGEFGPEPKIVNCPSCHASITSRIQYETSQRTHLFACLLCCLFFPCVWLPYVMKDCKNTTHYCSECGAFLGSYVS